MPKEKLNRAEEHAINVHSTDEIELWQSRFNPNGWNLTVKTGDIGQLRLYSLSQDQLSSLGLQISQALGRMPDITRYDVEQCHDRLGQLLRHFDSGREIGPEDSPAGNDPAPSW